MRQHVGAAEAEGARVAGLDLQEHTHAIRLSGEAKSVAHEQRATSNQLGECLALDQFHAGDWQQVRELVSKGSSFR